MLTLSPSSLEQAQAFSDMEQADGTSVFIYPYSAQKHTAEMASDDIVYLSIYQQNKLIGFIILALENEGRVEFRRIVIAEKGKGFGQLAMQKMEQYCKDELQAKSIWLDVFELNTRGMHIYQKLGYSTFKKQESQGKVLVFMEKSIV